MKILLLSDTHNYLDESMINHAREADEIWHAGDIGTIAIADKLQAIKPLRAVWGNIDGKDVRVCFPQDNRFNINGLDVLITHIGGYPNYYDARIRKIIAQHPPDLFICGHSHILKVMRDSTYGLLHMNPGAAGIHGFHKVRTMIRFEVNNGKIQKPEVIELGLRGKLP